MTITTLATRVLLAASVALVPLACGGSSDTSGNSSPSSVCTPGQTEQCTCDDGATGARTCDENGEFLECVCMAASPCGNGTIDMGEQCDGSNLGGETCASATMNAAPQGTLSCSASCTFVTSGCSAPAGTGGAGGTGGTMGAGATMGEGGLMGGGGMTF